MSTNIAYNPYSTMPNLPYNIIEYLLYNNETIWKLLKYPERDALDKPNLTNEEKALLIYNGEIDSQNYRVFQQEFTDDSFETQCTQLRIFPYGIEPTNRTVGVLDLSFEINTHVKIEHLSNYTSRINVLISELISTLNGVEIGGMGVLFFDYGRRRTNGMRRVGSNNKNFFVAKLTMSCNIGG